VNRTHRGTTGFQGTQKARFPGGDRALATTSGRHHGQAIGIDSFEVDDCGRPCDRPPCRAPPSGARGFRGWRELFGAGVMPQAGSDRWWLYPASRRSGASVHDTLGHGKTQGPPCDLHRRPVRPSRFARIRRRRSAIAWRDTPNSRATAPWPTSSTRSAHSWRVACSSTSSRAIRPSSECRCRFSGVVRSLRGRGTHSGYPLRGVLPRGALTERSIF
jgi:hypothetical protein